MRYGPDATYDSLELIEKFLPVLKRYKVIEFGCDGGSVCKVLVDLFANYWNKVIDYIGIEEEDLVVEFRHNTENTLTEIVGSKFCPHDPSEYSIELIEGNFEINEQILESSKFADIVIFYHSLRNDTYILSQVMKVIPTDCLVVIVGEEKFLQFYQQNSCNDMKLLYNTSEDKDKSSCCIYRKTYTPSTS